MDEPDAPSWWVALSDDDRQFLKRFLLASGSLKALAREYGVSYPTIRGRLDRLIAKVRIADRNAPADAFERTVQMLVLDGALAPGVARSLLNVYRDGRASTALNEERQDAEGE